MAASPTFAGSPAGLAAVKLETGSSAATPRPSLSGQSIAVPAGEQASRAVTPRVSIASATAGAVSAEAAAQPAPEAATNGKQERTPSIFDASHIPTLQTRIHSLTKLIIAAGADAHSLAVPKASGGGADGTEDQAEAAMAPPPTVVLQDYAPNVTLGAATDDDINSGYEAALSLSFGDAAAAATQNQQPTALAEALVREGTGLRDAFARAQRAISALDGGDMDLEEQEHLIQLLQHYNGEQRRIRRSFSAQSSSIPLSADTRMAVD